MERNLSRDLKNAEKFAQISAFLDAFEKNKRIIRVTLSNDGDKEKFEELLELQKEYSKIMARVKNREQGFAVIEEISKLNLVEVGLKADYIKKVLEQEYLKLDDGASTKKKTFNEKMKTVLEEGAKMTKGKNKEELIEEAKEQSPVALLMMEIMKKLANGFASEIKRNNVRVVVPVDPETEKADFDNVKLKYGEQGITEISLDEALKSISTFLPLIIHAELQQSFNVNEARKKGESK
ncbi:MAG: hypothetical protein ACRC7F_07170 [Cetobacterium sp.]